MRSIRSPGLRTRKTASGSVSCGMNRVSGAGGAPVGRMSGPVDRARCLWTARATIGRPGCANRAHPSATTVLPSRGGPRWRRSGQPGVVGGAGGKVCPATTPHRRPSALDAPRRSPDRTRSPGRRRARRRYDRFRPRMSSATRRTSSSPASAAHPAITASTAARGAPARHNRHTSSAGVGTTPGAGITTTGRPAGSPDRHRSTAPLTCPDPRHRRA